MPESNSITYGSETRGRQKDMNKRRGAITIGQLTRIIPGALLTFVALIKLAK